MCHPAPSKQGARHGGPPGGITDVLALLAPPAAATVGAVTGVSATIAPPAGSGWPGTAVGMEVATAVAATVGDAEADAPTPFDDLPGVQPTHKVRRPTQCNHRSM